NGVTSVAFSPNGQFILTGSRDDTAILWDLEGQIIKTFEGYSNIVTSVAFSPNGQFILTGSWNGTAILWDLEGQKIKSFEGHSNEVTSVAFSPNGQFILTGSWDGTAILWDLEGQKIKSFEGHSNEVTSVAFSPKGQFILTGSKDNTQKLWSTTVQLNDASKPKELATLVAIDTSDWIVTTPDGLFDASPGAMNWMHYSVFDQKNREYLAIELEQLKARYYEPGLLQKILGNTNEGLRPVENFDTVALYPKIKLAQIDSTGTLQLQLSERNGGIGKVSLFINGKEVEEEANPLPRRENAQRDSSIQIDLSKYRNYLFRHPDSTNTVSIRVYNEAGWLKSPAFNLEYQVAAARSRGGEGTGNNSSWTGKFDPKLYVITIGTSDYSGTKLDLQYGDQDATMMARAFQAVGTALLEADSLEVHCLTTARADSTGLEGTPIAWHNAGKNDIRSVFDKIKNQAKAEDIVVVYLSGHGVTQGGTDQTLFYYLTKDIASEDALSDPATRRAYAISSEELTDWLKAIPALKQVLIIDACNSGQIVENLTGGTKALNSSQIRALDRMQDRTGMFVLSGSAADKVSYEASEYGQGLLTYALLEGMRSATRSVTDGKEMVKMIDVMTLFQYARDRVPELATSINGIQTPMLGFPSRAASFDIGILNDQASVAIPITKGKPIMIRSTFLNEATYRDDLRLADSLEAAFREETKKGADADLVYVDVYDYPNAYSLGGFYRQRADGIALKLRLLHGDEAPVTLEIPVTEDLEKLVKLIVRAVKKEIP
ncbi:caspase family protein, partial [Flavilitoribacter nigricans]